MNQLSFFEPREGRSEELTNMVAGRESAVKHSGDWQESMTNAAEAEAIRRLGWRWLLLSPEERWEEIVAEICD